MSTPFHYGLRLYVTGMTPRSLRAIEAVRTVCHELLRDCHALEIIDVYQQPHRISEDQVVAIPTLVKYEPAPRRWIVGDMSDRRRLVDGLGLREETAPR